MRRWIEQSPVTIGVVVVVVGLVAIFLGWNGAAGKDFVAGQIPYVISGGLLGLGLVATGLAVVVIHAVRREFRDIENRLEELIDAVRDMGASTASTIPALAAVGDEPLVIAGRTTYHRPDCRLVQGRTTGQPMTVEAASERGLNACRICRPAA